MAATVSLKTIQRQSPYKENIKQRATNSFYTSKNAYLPFLGGKLNNEWIH